MGTIMQARRVKLMNRQQVMNYLGGISKSMFYKLVSEGKLGAVYKIGSSIRVPEDAVEQYLEDCKQEPGKDF